MNAVKKHNTVYLSWKRTSITEILVCNRPFLSIFIKKCRTARNLKIQSSLLVHTSVWYEFLYTLYFSFPVKVFVLWVAKGDSDLLICCMKNEKLSSEINFLASGHTWDTRGLTDEMTGEIAWLFHPLGQWSSLLIWTHRHIQAHSNLVSTPEKKHNWI